MCVNFCAIEKSFINSRLLCTTKTALNWCLYVYWIFLKLTLCQNNHFAAHFCLFLQWSLKWMVMWRIVYIMYRYSRHHKDNDWYLVVWCLQWRQHFIWSHCVVRSRIHLLPFEACDWSDLLSKVPPPLCLDGFTNSLCGFILNFPFMWFNYSNIFEKNIQRPDAIVS